MAQELSDRYNPTDVESRIYNWWETQGFFKAEDSSTRPPFCIILPPPNVTGYLHMGHALDHTIQDVMIRWKRMSGFNALWLPGTDHAGIATQNVVEKELKKEEVTRHQLGRSAFVEKIWSWKQTYGERIYGQMRRLGDSCDWDRRIFTLDDGVSKSVRQVFVSLYKRNLIYKGSRVVNWSGPLETAISDLEVETKPIKGTLWHLKYKLENSNQFLIIATTRPETLLGDTAVCVHPEDERYKSLIGQNVILPLLGKKLPIIADEYVDRAFGSGVVKITPAHDFNDFKIGKAHNLPMINIMNKKTQLNENAGPYQGLSVIEARKKILEDLKALDLIEKEEPHAINLGFCSRSGAVVEPYLSDQWFMKMEPLAKPAQRAVESGTIRFEPESWTKVYLHWMSIIEDWCISRQLWWGHRIPVWNCKSCGHVNVSETDPTHCEKCKSTELEQEEDVLDTWFSSALWPFSTLGWPQDTEALKTFYPTNVLVTGHDIIFFWVARMIMMGLEFKKDVPFRKVYLHGLIRDAQGRKISKSLGNAVDPVEMIEKFGADALRFSFMAHLNAGKDFKFSEQRVEGYRNFMNKVWNAFRFSLMNMASADFKSFSKDALPLKENLSVFDQWILRKLEETEASVEKAMEQDQFAEAAQAIYQFVWYQFCDWHIEFMKPIFSGADSPQKLASQWVLAQLLNRICRLLHPFTPFISEELYQKIPIKNQACIVDQYPTVRLDKELLSLGARSAEFEVDLIKEVVTAVRNVRGENRISPAIKLKLRLVVSDEIGRKVIASNHDTLMQLARLEELKIEAEGSLAKCAVVQIHLAPTQVKVIIPLEGLVDIAEEIKRLEKVLEKSSKDQSVLSQRLANENFVKNASEEVVEADRLQIKQLQDQIIMITESLIRLKS